MQTVWKGSIAFGLVSIPVRLVSATEEKDISLRQVHEADGGRIKYKRVCSIDGEEVAYSNIAKGYEVSEGEMVILKDEDFSNLPIASNKTVEVLSFADADEINPIALSRAYYADPTGDAKPYVLLHDTLVATNKVAIVKVALRQKERLATVRAQDGVLVIHTMLWPDEVRTPAFGFMNE
ncbi:MAG TPA: Ku protein, partial [Actinomycetes bacterium]|nr:Ku protein [Actinomycetes bacterium]